MPNLLIKENSPYLLQHADNPVEWYPWGEEALIKARTEDKPIFLSIGYAACHWCHVMAHESFEDPETANIMNRFFVNIKVDREERPELDTIYMNAVVAMVGHGGWPLSVFLTPEGKPFYGGTYFPPERRYNMPSFHEVLETTARLWKQDRNRLLNSSDKITKHIEKTLSVQISTQELDPSILEKAAFQLAQSYDWVNGGWGKAPKFPQPMAIEFLLQRAARNDRLALDICIHALTAMAKGGMYDVVGGGFARYSTDEKWLVPHFEKMLYDNAQLARVYLHAFLLTREPQFRRVCEETLDFIVREMMQYSTENPYEGGFFSSLDADSEGEEGKYYVWSLSEIQTVLENVQSGNPNLWNFSWVEFFKRAYNLNEKGNFEDRYILQRHVDDSSLADDFDLSTDTVTNILSQMHRALLETRNSRIRPGTDDKVLVAWNALALTAFSEAARYLNRPDYLEVARKNADFLLTQLHPNDRLIRSWRIGNARNNAYLEDYASLIIGLLSLYQTDPSNRWFNAALTLTEEMLNHFRDLNGGFFDTRDDHEALLFRPKDIQDNATPSGNALAALALLQLSIYTGNREWRNIAEEMVGVVQVMMAKYPAMFSKWLCALDFALSPVQEIVILGDPTLQSTHALITTLWSAFRPFALAAISSYPAPPDSPTLLKDRTLFNNQPTAFVCQDFTCRKPVNQPDEFLAQLSITFNSSREER